MEINSVHNNKIKNLLKLQQKSRERKKQKLFVVEGWQENKLAIDNGFEPLEYFICKQIFEKIGKLPPAQEYFVTQELFAKIAYRGKSGGIVGLYKFKYFSLEELDLSSNILLTVLESVEKPGNLGAILRTCDAAKVDAVIVCEPTVDFYNPNVIRSSVGTIFTHKLVSCSNIELVDFCKRNQIQILSTFLKEDTLNLYDANFSKSTAMIFGTEATGLSDFWLTNSTHTIQIPMLGQIDSLNVSNAVAICIFEAVRQRRYSD